MKGSHTDQTAQTKTGSTGFGKVPCYVLVKISQRTFFFFCHATFFILPCLNKVSKKHCSLIFHNHVAKQFTYLFFWLPFDAGAVETRR